MFYLAVVIAMTSSFFSIKNKLGLASLIVLGFLWTASVAEAGVTEGINDLSSEKEILLLSIHRVENTYYVVLEASLKDKKNDKKYSDKVLKKTEDIEKTIPLGISRKEYKKILKNSRLPAYKGDLLQE